MSFVPISLLMKLPSVHDLNVFFPQTFIEFVLYYGGGMTAVFIVFTAILFERSFRIKGIIYGILYCAVSVVYLFCPNIGG